MGRLKNKLAANKHVNRYMTDKKYRITVTLCLSLAFNGLYAAWQIGCGAYYRSFWFITSGSYYIVLSLLRTLLVGPIKKDGIGSTKYRLCGIILLFMNVILIGMVVMVVHGSVQVKTYAEYMVYGMAAYAFYKITVAITGFVKYRNNDNSAISAAKIVSLVSALFSMLSLAIVMIPRFGGGTEFLNKMTIYLGAGVGISVSLLAVYMIINAKNADKREE